MTDLIRAPEWWVWWHLSGKKRAHMVPLESMRDSASGVTRTKCNVIARIVDGDGEGARTLRTGWKPCPKCLEVAHVQ